MLHLSAQQELTVSCIIGDRPVADSEVADLRNHVAELLEYRSAELSSFAERISDDKLALTFDVYAVMTDRQHDINYALTLLGLVRGWMVKQEAISG